MSNGLDLESIPNNFTSKVSEGGLNCLVLTLPQDLMGTNRETQ